MTFIMLRYFLSILSLLSVFCEGMLNFARCFFLNSLRWSYQVFPPSNSVNMVYYTDWFSYVKLSLHFRNKFYLVMLYNLFLTYYFFKFISLFWERQRQRELGGAERERERENPNQALCWYWTHKTSRSWPKLKPSNQHLTDWASQVPVI